MIWRKLKLDWSYAVGELLIVVVGVLIALAIDQWNDDRLERLEEIEAIARLLADVKADSKEFDFRLQAVAEKEESLLRVRRALNKENDIDPASFLSDIVKGADFGWNQGVARRATYDNLLGSGKLAIIADPNIRNKIAEYYRYYRDSHNRIDERETEYPALSYRLVPRSETLMGEGVVWERDVESGLSTTELGEILASVRRSPIRDHVIAELNLARFIRHIELDLQNRAESLISDLEDYQERLR